MREEKTEYLYQQKTYPPSENRVWDFFEATYSCSSVFVSEVTGTHQETEPVTTIIASGVHYYGYRYYNTEWGRWLNRDPIGEWGGSV